MPFSNRISVERFRIRKIRRFNPYSGIWGKCAIRGKMMIMLRIGRNGTGYEERKKGERGVVVLDCRRLIDTREGERERGNVIGFSGCGMWNNQRTKDKTMVLVGGWRGPFVVVRSQSKRVIFFNSNVTHHQHAHTQIRIFLVFPKKRNKRTTGSSSSNATTVQTT